MTGDYDKSNDKELCTHLNHSQKEITRTKNIPHILLIVIVFIQFCYTWFTILSFTVFHHLSPAIFII